jgi:hypothetical protein
VPWECVVGLSGKVAHVRHRLTRAIRVGGVDVEVRRTADMLGEVGQNGGRRIVVPVPVPDQVGVGPAQNEVSAVVEDPIAAAGFGSPSRTAVVTSVARMIDRADTLAVGSEVAIIVAVTEGSPDP